MAMEDEKKFLNRDLENAKTKEDLDFLAKDAKDLGYKDIAKLAEERMAVISAKAESVGETSKEKIAQIEFFNGNVVDLNTKTEASNKEIAKVKSDAGIKINEVIKDQDGVEMPKLEAISISPEKIEKLKAELAEAKKFQKAKHAMSRWQDLYWAIKENQEVPHVMHVETWKGEDGPADDYKAEMERLENSEELAPWRENFKKEPDANGYWLNWANPIALDMEKSYIEFLKDSGLSEKYKVYNVMIPSELFDKIPQDLEKEISTLEQEKEKGFSAKA